jgi:hypothetical protein
MELTPYEVLQQLLCQASRQASAGDAEAAVRTAVEGAVALCKKGCPECAGELGAFVIEVASNHDLVVDSIKEIDRAMQGAPGALEWRQQLLREAIKHTTGEVRWGARE